MKQFLTMTMHIITKSFLPFSNFALQMNLRCDCDKLDKFQTSYLKHDFADSIYF